MMLSLVATTSLLAGSMAEAATARMTKYEVVGNTLLLVSTGFGDASAELGNAGEPPPHKR